PWASARPLGRCSAEVDAPVRGRPLGGTPVALHRQRRFDEEIPDPVEANAFGDLLEELLLRLGWKLDSRCKLVRELPGIRRRYLDVAPGQLLQATEQLERPFDCRCFRGIVLVEHGCDLGGLKAAAACELEEPEP